MPAKKYWLMKTEPESFSIDDLEKQKVAPWEGVRNYQSRNYMREMRVGDGVLIHHSSTKIVGIAGVAKIVRAARADLTSLDPKSQYFDPKATHEDPRWSLVDVGFVERFPSILTMEALRRCEALGEMLVLKRGMRLSVQPVAPNHFQYVVRLGRLVSPERDESRSSASATASRKGPTTVGKTRSQSK